MKISSWKLLGSEKLSLGSVGLEVKDSGEEGELRAKANDSVLGLKHNFLMFWKSEVSLCKLCLSTGGGRNEWLELEVWDIYRGSRGCLFEIIMEED